MRPLCDRLSRCLIPLTLALPLHALADDPLAGLDQGMVGPRAQVLVLATAHLRYLPADFDAKALDGLMRRLAGFKPDVITVELQPPAECDLVKRRPEKYGEGYNCSRTEAAKAATGLDIPAALQAVEKTLKTWPAQPSAAQRRALAALFLASGDTPSALVQWLRLPPGERKEGDTLDAALVAQLEQLTRQKDESLLIGARLAAQLGLERVHAIDNHTGDFIEVEGEEEKIFWNQLQTAWKDQSPQARQDEEQTEALKHAPDLLPMYRQLNRPDVLRRLAQSNVAPAMRYPSPQRYPQWWVAGWEIRNLRMVANIRETFREHPGARVLSIVGASHKPWFDHWLGQLQGVGIVDAEQVLD
ncbi:DUF5694 domain-containing protein [Ideonella sp. B508-1]|uniref:DUF5694 domain-containing protein n=1 Tax=Ideonella sp. B508-1 TaxID=137716 RepID=UPI00034DB58D|nr:DUF5694 domain-containing protein [Ideonella sp. B508-1]